MGPIVCHFLYLRPFAMLLSRALPTDVVHNSTLLDLAMWLALTNEILTHMLEAEGWNELTQLSLYWACDHNCQENMLSPVYWRMRDKWKQFICGSWTRPISAGASAMVPTINWSQQLQIFLFLLHSHCFTWLALKFFFYIKSGNFVSNFCKEPRRWSKWCFSAAPKPSYLASKVQSGF